MLKEFFTEEKESFDLPIASRKLDYRRLLQLAYNFVLNSKYK